MTSNFPIVTTEEEFKSSNPGYCNDVWTELIIQAPPAVVRATVLDFKNRSSFDPFYRHIEVVKGQLDDLDTKPAISLTFDFDMDGKKEMTVPFHPTISRNDEECLVWGFRVVCGWFYMVDHVHVFVPIDDGKATRLVNYERICGFMKYFTPTKTFFAPFHASNAALKKVCEERAK